MALDSAYQGTISAQTGLSDYLGSWSVDETAGSTALVKFRDGFNLPGAPTAVDGSAGNSTSGLHMYAVTILTAQGESILGAFTAAGYTSAGSKHVTLTVPAVTRVGDTTAFVGGRDVIIGRNVYATKAGAPATLVAPTNAQWCLVATAPSTTLTSANNSLDLTQVSTLTLTDSTVVGAAGYVAVATTTGTWPVKYSANVANVITIASVFNAPQGSYMATSGAVTGGTMQDNTTTTYDLNIADGSFTATHPPLKSTAGSVIAQAHMAAVSGGSSLGESLNNAAVLTNGGYLTVEVNSGTVSWVARGQ